MNNPHQVTEVTIQYKSKVKPSDRAKIAGSWDAESLLRPFFEECMEHHECFYAMYLNRANKVLGVIKVSEGGLTATVVDQRIIMQPAILLNASGIIIAHNHPSGNFDPSQADKILTKTLKDAAKLFDISLLDHLILTPEGFLSFADEGLI